MFIVTCCKRQGEINRGNKPKTHLPVAIRMFYLTQLQKTWAIRVNVATHYWYALELEKCSICAEVGYSDCTRSTDRAVDR